MCDCCIVCVCIHSVYKTFLFPTKNKTKKNYIYKDKYMASVRACVNYVHETHLAHYYLIHIHTDNEFININDA